MDDTLNQARQAFLDGIEQFERDQFESALILFDQALQLAPDKPSELMNLGVTYAEAHTPTLMPDCKRFRRVSGLER